MRHLGQHRANEIGPEIKPLRPRAKQLTAFDALRKLLHSCCRSSAAQDWKTAMKPSRSANPSRLSLVRFVALLFAFISPAGILAQTAPTIVSVTPANGSTNAAPHDSIVIVFDQQMANTLPMLSV